MNAFPAAPGTYLVMIEPDSEYLPPVVGWQVSGVNALPVVAGHPGPLVAGEGVVFPDDTVLDLATNRVFKSEDDWRQDYEDDPKYRLGSALSVPVAAPVAAPAAPTPAPAAPKLPVAAKAPGGALAFDGKTYAKASFWKGQIAGEWFVFTVPPDHRAPTGPVEKITREVYFELRKSIPETTVEAILNPESAAPAAEEPEVDDDDGDDLI